ncbi:hypothetical protein WJX84_010678 [Apatococcus fuscideae]
MQDRQHAEAEAHLLKDQIEQLKQSQTTTRLEHQQQLAELRQEEVPEPSTPCLQQPESTNESEIIEAEPRSKHVEAQTETLMKQLRLVSDSPERLARLLTAGMVRQQQQLPESASLPAPKLRPIKTQAVERQHAVRQGNQLDAPSQLDKENAGAPAVQAVSKPASPQAAKGSFMQPPLELKHTSSPSKSSSPSAFGARKKAARHGGSGKRLGFDLQIPDISRRAPKENVKLSTQRQQFAELKLEKFFNSQEDGPSGGPSGSRQLSVKD